MLFDGNNKHILSWVELSWASCGSIGMVTTGQELAVDGFPASPHSMQIPHPCRQDPGTYEAILSDQPQQSTVLTRCGLLWSPHGLALHQVPVATCPRRMWLTVVRVRPTRPAITLCRMPSWESASNTCLISAGVGWSIIRKIGESWEKYTIVDLNLNWKSGQGKVGFHWGAVTGTLNFMSISAHWNHINSIHIAFIVSNGGVTSLFSKVYSPTHHT